VIPSVKAYRGPLPAGQPGIEFTTAIAPDPRSSTPYEARWYYPKTPGVELNALGFAWIPAKITKIV